MRRNSAFVSVATLAYPFIVLWLLRSGALGSLAMPVKFYPVAVNLALLVSFGHSLLRPPSVVERIARLREPVLPPQGIKYTRYVTAAWCGFFLLNGTIAAWLAIRGSDAVWATYCGAVAYVLAGILFAGEYMVRRRLRRKWANA